MKQAQYVQEFSFYAVLVCRAVVVVYKGELYILSGYNGIHDLHFDDMYRFNPGKQCTFGFLYHCHVQLYPEKSEPQIF